MAALVCWHCGTSLQHVPQPLARLAQCKSCGADLHVCRLCRFFDPQHSDHCDHEMADPAREVDIANFCHYFRMRADAYNPTEKSRADDALAQLHALFGEEEDKTANTREPSSDSDAGKLSDKDRFDALFKKD